MKLNNEIDYENIFKVERKKNLEKKFFHSKIKNEGSFSKKNRNLRERYLGNNRKIAASK